MRALIYLFFIIAFYSCTEKKTNYENNFIKVDLDCCLYKQTSIDQLKKINLIFFSERPFQISSRQNYLVISDTNENMIIVNKNQTYYLKSKNTDTLWSIKLLTEFLKIKIDTIDLINSFKYFETYDLERISFMDSCHTALMFKNERCAFTVINRNCEKSGYKHIINNWYFRKE
jgi:hypothetical protein